VKSKIKLIEFPVFCGYVIHVEITSDIPKALLKYPQTRKIDMDNETQGLAVHDTDAPFSFIFLPHNASVGDIAHESWHAVRRMMEYVGAELDNEAVAYHLGYMVQEIFKFVRGRK